MSRAAPTDAPLLPAVAARWSPRAFSERPVSDADLHTVLEAARWAPSCFNAQPWRFVVATRDTPDTFALLSDLLLESNRRWATAAPVLMLTAAVTTFAHNGKPNRHAWHDVGLAAGQLCVQAAALGLQVHQMAGFSVEQARARLALPENIDPVAMLALGYPGDPASLPDDLAAREVAPRQRSPLADLLLQAPPALQQG